MADPTIDPAFPCSLTIDTPFPTHRLALSALRALQVDAELSPLVFRTFSLATPSPLLATSSRTTNGTIGAEKDNIELIEEEQEKTTLRTEYKATTNRMLRVAVNGFLESLGVVLGIMEELDVDVLGGEHS